MNESKSHNRSDLQQCVCKRLRKAMHSSLTWYGFLPTLPIYHDFVPQPETRRWLCTAFLSMHDAAITTCEVCHL